MFRNMPVCGSRCAKAYAAWATGKRELRRKRNAKILARSTERRPDTGSSIRRKRSKVLGDSAGSSLGVRGHKYKRSAEFSSAHEVDATSGAVSPGSASTGVSGSAGVAVEPGVYQKVKPISEWG